MQQKHLIGLSLVCIGALSVAILLHQEPLIVSGHLCKEAALILADVKVQGEKQINTENYLRRVYDSSTEWQIVYTLNPKLTNSNSGSSVTFGVGVSKTSGETRFMRKNGYEPE